MLDDDVDDGYGGNGLSNLAKGLAAAIPLIVLAIVGLAIVLYCLHRTRSKRCLLNKPVCEIAKISKTEQKAAYKRVPFK